MAAKGKALLKVTGILLLVVASLSLLFAVLALMTGSSAFAAGNYDSEAGVAVMKRAMSYMLLAGSSFLGGAANLVAGIFGVKYAAHPEKAQRCLLVGIIAVALNVLLFLGNLVSFSSYAAPLGNILLLSLLICYVVGAVMNRPGKGTPAKGN